MLDPARDIDPRPLGEFGRDYYTCMRCNLARRHDEPGFHYFEKFTASHWAVREGIVKVGDLRNRRDLIGGFSTLGFFARCYDEEACAARRANTHAGVHELSISLLEEASR